MDHYWEKRSKSLFNAGWWNDPVHAEVFNHLPVFVGCMNDNSACGSGPRHGPSARSVYALKRIRGGDCADCIV